MLLLVDFTLLDRGVGFAETVETGSDRLQASRVVPVHEFRPNEPGVRTMELGHEQRDRSGVGGDVVVADEEQPVVAGDEVEDAVGGGGEPVHRVDGTHQGVGKYLADRGRRGAVRIA